MQFGYSGHLCRSCYNCKGRYCHLGKRWTFFIACRLWFDKNLREGNPAVINLIKKLNKEKEKSRELRRLWLTWMKIADDKIQEMYELRKCGYRLEGY